MYQNILTEIDAGVGIVSLNRPERRNALDETMLAELTDAMDRMAGDDGVRVVVVSSTGSSFCAGSDLNWLQHAADNSFEENKRAAGQLAEMLLHVSECPKPVIARVQGPAMGDGVGLVAACDMAVALFDVRFALTAVRLGQIPAITGPHLIAAIGERNARRYMLTGETFSAAEAYRLGLIHEMVPEESGLDDAIAEWIESLLKNGPQALAECKALIRSVSGRPLGPKVIDYTVERIAQVRTSPEGQEGLAAFLQKRNPHWAR